jgi:ABC-type multidrug transport system ATPase subunit
MARTRRNIPEQVEHAALLADNVSKTYGNAPALDPVTLSIATGERVAVIGHNGSGKTTLIRIASGLLEASTGTVSICGHESGSLNARASLSYIADQPTFYDDLTLWEHMEYVARLHQAAEWEQVAADLLDHLGLYERADEMPNRFSRGLKQKSAIALGFIRPFDVLLVDEPFVGLDASGKEALLELLDVASENGSTVVVATHELSFVHTVSRIVALRDGRLVYDGQTEGIDVDRLVRTEDPAGEHDGEQH